MRKMVAIAGIIVSLLLLMYLAYRNHSVIVIAPICALVAVGLDGELPLLASYTQIFLESLSKFISRYFAMFLLGAVFGKLMEETGSAAVIAMWILRWVGADRALLALVLTCAALTYGGVSLFVVVFTVFPLGVALFRQADLPRRLMPAAIALGAFTFTMTAMPGSVQIQNLIPMPYFKTTSFAAPLMGCTAALIIFTVGMLWLNFRVMRLKQQGEGFSVDNEVRTTEDQSPRTLNNPPPLMVALCPLIGLVVLNFVLSLFVVPGWDASYLAEAKFGATELKKVQGPWATILAMVAAIVLIIALHWRKANELKEVISRGAQSSLMPVFNAASEFGYGSTIASLTGFATVKAWMIGLAPSQPLISEAISVNVLAGITGSASGGLSIALEAMGQSYIDRGLEAGLDPEVMHRIASLSCGGLDTLPHNGAVITLLLICGCSHKQSYWDIAVVSILGPMLATGAVLAMFG
jgi:H+/gluconate symporter-like permease